MSHKIKVLPDNLINKIAAGEVIERPASVVKELVENSLDAGATEVLIDIEQSGKRLIRVADNGCGMPKVDARTAFERHATSKISREADLEAITTLGFRGEALSSIAAVSQVRLTTAERGAGPGALVEIEGGSVTNISDAAASPGTVIEISHLFYNTPARQKFLKSPGTEFSHIVTAISHQALAHPSVRFRLTHNKKPVLDLAPAAALRERAFQLHGEELTANLTDFSGGRDGVRIFGLASRPSYTRGDRTMQEFYVNGRPVRNASLSHALYDAYRDLLMRDRHPAGFVFIELNPALVDVNVHPAKAEVRFRNQAQIHDLVRDVIREALRAQGTDANLHESSADRVKDAVSEYLESAEFGVRSAEFNFKNAISTALDKNVHPALRTSHFALLVPLAQVHDSFIIAQDNEGMALIDQHAAHERVLFEKLQDQLAAGTVEVQNMLLPVQIEFGPAEQELLREHLDELNRLGFVIEPFGGNSWMIKSAPALLSGADYKQLLHDILDEMKLHGRSGRMDELRDEVLSVMACHPAIKVHRKLSLTEMERLIVGLFSCRMPHSCPHGRPTVVRFSMDEIKRMFKRM